MQASSRNDGMVHPGVDLLPGQVKRRYNMRGNRMYGRICQEMDVPFRRSGQYLCFQSKKLAAAAWVAQLYYLIFGPRCRFLGKKAFFRREPNMSPKIRAALFFPAAGVVSPYGLTIAYAENAADNGARISLDTAVLGMQVQNGEITSVSTNRGTVYPKVVVNAAGVFSEEVARMANDRFFSIHPRKGTNTILDHKAAKRMAAIVSSFGTASTKKKHTKGGGLVRTIDDNTLVGPDAVETFLHEDFTTCAQNVADVFEKQRLTDPALSTRDAITYFSGIRAATYEEDFVIRKGRRTQNIIHAAGIQSPGVTAAPAIAVDVSKRRRRSLAKHSRVQEKILLQSGSERDLSGKRNDGGKSGTPDPAGSGLWRNCLPLRTDSAAAKFGTRCTEAFPAIRWHGVKRRVRPGMGRCQGGFCGRRCFASLRRKQKKLLTGPQMWTRGELLYGTIKEVKPCMTELLSY